MGENLRIAAYYDGNSFVFSETVGSSKVQVLLIQQGHTGRPSPRREGIRPPGTDMVVSTDSRMARFHEIIETKSFR